jgi:hypothetical protein
MVGTLSLCPPYSPDRQLAASRVRYDASAFISA